MGGIRGGGDDVKLIRRFTDEPQLAELDRALVAFERNVDDAIRAAQAASAPRYNVIRTDRDCEAGPGDLVLIDALDAAVVVTLRTPAPEDEGCLVALARIIGANTVTVQSPVAVIGSASISSAYTEYVATNDGYIREY